MVPVVVPSAFGVAAKAEIARRLGRAEEIDPAGELGLAGFSLPIEFPSLAELLNRIPTGLAEL